MRVKTKKSVSRLLAICIIFLLKEAFPKAAYAFLSSVDACAAKPECASAVSSELAPAIAAPTAGASGTTTVSTTTATGTTTTYAKAAGVTVVGDMRLSGVATYYIWTQAQSRQAQQKAVARYCAAYPKDQVCLPFTGGQEVGIAYRFKAENYREGKLTGTYVYDVWGPIHGLTREVNRSQRKIQHYNQWTDFYEGAVGNYLVCHGLTTTYNHHYTAETIKVFVGGVTDGDLNRTALEERLASDRSVILSITRVDAQPDTGGNPPPLNWQAWSPKKRNAAIKSLTNADWRSLIKSMPEGGKLNPGDTVNAPKIIIPGTEEDDPNTPADERLLRKPPGFFTWPGLPDTDFDKDGTPDSADPEPQNPNVPKASENPSEPTPEERNPAQDQRLSRGEIEALKSGGEDPEALKDYNAGLDLFKDKKGNIYVKPKDGSGPGEETGLNINDFL